MGGIEGAKNLRDFIKSKFAGSEPAETAIAEIEQQRTEASPTKFAKYLDLEMDEDQTFAAAEQWKLIEVNRPNVTYLWCLSQFVQRQEIE